MSDANVQLNSSSLSALLPLASVLVGIFLHWFDVPYSVQLADMVSKAFVNLMKFISLPIIFFSLSATIARLKVRETAGKILQSTLYFSLSTTLVAALIAMLLYALLDPSTGVIAVGDAPKKPFHLVWDINTWVPDNLFQMFAGQHIIAVVIFALLCGWLTLSLPDDEQALLSSSLSAFYALFIAMASKLIQLLPFVIWAFVLILLKQQHAQETLLMLARYLICVLSANVLQGFLVLPLLLVVHRIAVYPLLQAMWPVLMVAFISKSSTGTLPMTVSYAINRANMDPEKAKIILPLCSTVNMNACAAFIYITVLFVSEVNGLTFTLTDHVLWVFLSVMAAFGNAGVPMGCYFMSAAYLVNMGVPTDLMGLILPFYALLDMLETAINVWSDVVILALMNRQVQPAD